MTGERQEKGKSCWSLWTSSMLYGSQRVVVPISTLFSMEKCLDLMAWM